MLRSIAETGEGSRVDLGTVVDSFGRRGFGALLLVAILPAFLPLPVGVGAIAGPLVVLVGLQLLANFKRPWVPRFARRWSVSRDRFARFTERLAPWLDRLEKLARPRLPALIGHAVATSFTGLMLIATGLLLFLPIPFTNYPIGLLLLVYCIALIERDGAAMLVCWLLSIAGGVTAVLLSDQAIELIQDWL